VESINRHVVIKFLQNWFKQKVNNAIRDPQTR
jgi:hypothetical protein